MAKATLGSPYAYVTRQAVFALAGMVALLVLMRVDYRQVQQSEADLSADGR